MRRYRGVVGAAVIAVILLGGAVARGIEPGETAPPFDLPLVTGEGALGSGSLFADHDYVFIIFWTSGCPRCVEALRGCEDFHRTYGGADVAVVGVCAVDRDLLAVRGIIQASALSFPQLRDVDGATAGRYGIPRETFAVCLVGRHGVVLDASVDPEGDTYPLMESMLTMSGASSQESGASAVGRRGADAVPDGGEEAEEGLAGFSLHGTERIRFLAVDSRGAEAVGAYGESVSPGDRLHYRFELEMTRQVVKGLRVGGLLRIGNEGRRVLDSGPQYLGSEWGSAFVTVEVHGVGLRLGYYPIALTPLTLMRWDWDDSPRLGGDGGCGCGASAGALLLEGLDELAPQLVVEGATALYSASDFEARAFYAMPRRPSETNYTNYRAGVAEKAHYALELYGFEGKWRRLDARTGLFWETAVHAVGTAEDRRTVDFLALGYPIADPWTATWTVTVSGALPLVRNLRLRGEVVAWNRSEEHGVLGSTGTEDVAREGSGGYGGVVFERTADLAVALDYVRLDEDFYTPFSALSYESNAEGLRGSARLDAPRGLASLSLFYKRMSEVRAPSPLAERAETELAGAAVEAPIGSLLVASIGWLERTSWRRGASMPFDAYRRALTASVHHDFARIGALELRYQKVTNRSVSYGDESALAAESRSELYSVQVTVVF